MAKTKYSNKQLRAMMAKHYNLKEDDIRNSRGVQSATFKTREKAEEYGRGNLTNFRVREIHKPNEKPYFLLGGRTKHWSLQKYGESTPHSDKFKKINWKKTLKNQPNHHN